MSNYTLSNRKSPYRTVAEEKEANWQLTEEKLKVHLQILPSLLEKLKRIPDPRDPKKVGHRINVLMLYGILMFVFQLSSRRKANRSLTTPQLIENLKALCPELDDMPHQDTLSRFLECIDVSRIEDAYLDLLNELIRKKKFRNLLAQNRYLVAIDGTQKYTMGTCHDERYLRRKTRDGRYQYYAYVLEAVLVFSNGMVLPFMSEFLENTPELEAIENDEEWKQDCELKAFQRLAKRIKKRFPRLPITLLLDGLFANGPVIHLCQKNKWQFMIVLKDKSLPTVWEEVRGLMQLDTQCENSSVRDWQDCRQQFQWVNGIEYEYGRTRKVLTFHVVICEEKRTRTIGEYNTRYVWISSEPLNRGNVHALCNLAARRRWLHENNILEEKHQGYNYEHIYSYDWDAMRGYHYLMHIAHFLNELAIHSLNLMEYVKDIGIGAILDWFRISMTYLEHDPEQLRLLREAPGQLRLIYVDDWRHAAA